MIVASLFHTLAFPWLVVNQNGGLVERGPGTLFKFPPGEDEAGTINLCRRASPGFTCAPNGYAFYVHEMSFFRRYRLVLYGLKVVGVSTAQGRTGTLSIKLRQEEIRDYVEEFLVGAERSSRIVSELLNSSVHEIRGINTDIKHASQEVSALEFESQFEFAEIIRRAKNINALTEIMSRRTDFLEFVTNPYVTKVQRRRVRPYQKFDKVKRSLEPRARQRDVGMRLEGASLNTIDALAVFEVVPYVLIQNAVKYSPRTGNVVISASDEEGWILFKVANRGPEVYEDEFSALFEQGVRGRRSKEAGVSGSGFGLFFLKELVEVHHGGEIELKQEGETRVFGNVPYRWTVVELRLPRADR